MISEWKPATWNGVDFTEDGGVNNRIKKKNKIFIWC